MKKKIDNYDLFSILTLIVSFIACILFSIRGINISKQEDDIPTILLTAISSIFSIGGLIIAVLQIFKVSTNTKTYKEAYDRTIELVNNNASISLLGKASEQLGIIKHLFDTKREGESQKYFNHLAVDLSYLKSNKNIASLDRETLNAYIIYCRDMDVLVYKINVGAISYFDYSSSYETLSEMQLFLATIQQELSTPKQT